MWRASLVSQSLQLGSPSSTRDDAAAAVYTGLMELAAARYGQGDGGSVMLNTVADVSDVHARASSALAAPQAAAGSQRRAMWRRRLSQTTAWGTVAERIAADLSAIADDAAKRGLVGQPLLVEIARVARTAQVDAVDALAGIANGTQTAANVTSRLTGTALRSTVNQADVPGMDALRRTVREASSKPLSDFGFDSSAVPPPPPPPGKPGEWEWGQENATIVFSVCISLLVLCVVMAGIGYYRQKKQIVIPHDPLRARQLEMQQQSGAAPMHPGHAGLGMAPGRELQDVALTAESKAARAAQERAEFEEILRRQQEYIAQRLGRGAASPAL